MPSHDQTSTWQPAPAVLAWSDTADRAAHMQIVALCALVDGQRTGLSHPVRLDCYTQGRVQDRFHTMNVNSRGNATPGADSAR
jgi:hypothetical protein